MQMLWWMTRLLLFAAGMMTAPVLAQDAVGLTSEEQSPSTPGEGTGLHTSLN